MKSDLTIIRKR